MSICYLGLYLIITMFFYPWVIFYSESFDKTSEIKNGSSKQLSLLVSSSLVQETMYRENGHCVVRNLALHTQRKLWPTSLEGPVMSAFVIPDGPLRPHQIICANRMTQGEPLEPDGIQISRKGHGLDSEFNPWVKNQSIMPNIIIKLQLKSDKKLGWAFLVGSTLCGLPYIVARSR